LGSALLSALGKKDAETLSTIRANQELTVQKAIKQVKDLQVKDADFALENLNSYLDLLTNKYNYYQGLISNGLSSGEKAALALNVASTVIDDAIAVGYSLSGGLKLIPDFIAGVAGFGATPTATVKEGGKNFGDSAEDVVKTLSSIATALDKTASIASTTAGYVRRNEEWQFQLQIASDEITQVKNQIEGAKIRQQIANQEVSNQQILIDNASEISSFMVTKYTNEQLYSWMITQISDVYFKSYQQAYVMAKRAESCFRFELGMQSSSYINLGYWDNLKNGLLSGEQLMADIKQMEMDYLQLNAREFELTKHISLSQFDPLSLIQLKETGECFINIPEELFAWITRVIICEG